MLSSKRLQAGLHFLQVILGLLFLRRSFLNRHFGSRRGCIDSSFQLPLYQLRDDLINFLLRLSIEALRLKRNHGHNIPSEFRVVNGKQG